MKHTLSIYHISIYERRRKKNKIRLDDIDGISFLSILDGFIKEWLKGPDSIQKYEKEQKACRLKKDNDKESYCFRSSVIEGIIESGEYGKEIDVYDVDNGSKSSTIGMRQAPLMPFYFFFSIEEDSYDGYLILQKIGNNGIYSIFTEKLKSYAAKHIAGDYTIRISPFSSKILRDNTFKDITEARSITIQNKDTSTILDSLGLPSDGIKNEMKFYLDQGKTFKIPPPIKSLFNKAGRENKSEKDEPSKEESSDLNDSSDIMPINDYEISMEVKMPDGNFRKLTIGNMNSLGTSRTLPNNIQCNDNGFPTMQALKREAYKLLDIIKNQTE